MHRPLDYLLLAAAGAIGVLLRAGSVSLAVHLAGSGSGWAPQVATLAVNALGSLLFGVVSAVGTSRLGLSPAWQAIILVGLLGGFTTYSSFAIQSVEMLAHGRVVAAAGYVMATNLLALAAAWAGLRLAGG